MDKQSLIAALMSMSPSDYATGLANGARSFADQAKWNMGMMGNVPRPAPYEGGDQYPAADDANAYVRNNWPDETGIRGLHAVRPETFYTPSGMTPPPGGRGPYLGEVANGAPTIYQLRELLDDLKARRGR